MTVPGTSVQSAKCHITEPEIPTWQSIWQRNDGEGEGVVPKGECWTLAPCVLMTANQKQKRPE